MEFLKEKQLDRRFKFVWLIDLIVNKSHRELGSINEINSALSELEIVSKLCGFNFSWKIDNGRPITVFCAGTWLKLPARAAIVSETMKYDDIVELVRAGYWSEK